MRRADAGRWLLLAGSVALGVSCARRAAPPEDVQIGRHNVRLTTPAGWEHLDHGRAQLFRNGETELRLEDLGPATAAVSTDADSPPPTADQLVEYVLTRSDDTGREISRRDSIAVHGSPWIRLETWSRVSHTYRRLAAFTVSDSSVLALWTERGLFEQSSGAFDSLLQSIEVPARP